jgi:hypothetical protein
MGVGASCILISLPGNMKYEKTFAIEIEGVTNLVEVKHPCFQPQKRILAQVNESLVELHR